MSSDVGVDGDLTIGSGADADRTITFELGTDEYLFWDESEDHFSVTNDLNVAGGVTFGTGAAVDQTLTFNTDGSETLTWDESEDNFLFSNDISVTGGVKATGQIETTSTLDVDGAATFGSSSDVVISTAGALTYTRTNAVDQYVWRHDHPSYATPPHYWKFLPSTDAAQVYTFGQLTFAGKTGAEQSIVMGESGAKKAKLTVHGSFDALPVAGQTAGVYQGIVQDAGSHGRR